MIQTKQGSTISKPKKPFLRYMHNFRAFAIINIVLIHVISVPESCDTGSVKESVDIVRQVLFQSSALYFLFISGYLFYHLSHNFNIFKYYKGKVLNVLLPYLIISLLVLTLQYINRGIWEGSGQYLLKLVNGTVQYPYWYIPFVSILFIISPLLLKIPQKSFQSLTLMLCLLPLLGTSTGTDITIGQYVYFAPAYLGGMLFAMKSRDYLPIVEKYVRTLAVMAVVLTIILFVLFIYEVPTNIGFVDFMETLIYLHKVVITFVVIVLLKKWESKDMVLLDYFARYSFAIYFLHTIVDYGVMRTYFFCNVFDRDYFVVMAFLYGTAILFLTLGVSICLKKILGKHSRKIIGA